MLSAMECTLENLGSQHSDSSALKGDTTSMTPVTFANLSMSSRELKMSVRAIAETSAAVGPT